MEEPSRHNTEESAQGFHDVSEGPVAFAEEKNERLQHSFSKKVGKAIFDYNMIDEGDRILVAVSGGKDSLALLNILHSRLSFSPIRYSVIAVHVDLGYQCVHPKILETYFARYGYEYKIVTVDILEGGCKSRKDISCFWCSWNKRKAVFETAKALSCNKVAFGHHKDDIAETILMNMFFNSEISGMNPKQVLFNGELTLIRPLAYIDESEVAAFARTQAFPEHVCSCPNHATTRRNEAAKVIQMIEKSCPEVRTNIVGSLKRIKKDYIL
ncbi:MAG TPA: tRNA 2-thiocytidine(32) synthetase TtcA [Candidatus Omnitrophica bacterium]|nr:tRNA 2-thiocytidine(32) synthetase TtcA [Candidatus Omnitrophota bacterium]HBG63448.1 tRNA 2-thiocytidine(32) synthetase TtcA [Candidatus Omnitrophota bacterium]